MLGLRITFTLFTCFVVLGGASSMADDKKVTKQDLIDKWHGIFGEKIDFSDKPLFDCMVYLGSQPMSLFQDFGDKKLGGGLVNESSRWMDEFFKPEYRPDVRKMSPTKYYLPKGKEPGLLHYEWKTENCSVSMSETYNGILLTVKPSDFDAKKGIKDNDLAGILLKMLNFKYTDVATTIKGFNLPKTGVYGNVFTNAQPLRVGFIRGWKDHIVVFLSKDSINVLCFKAVEGRSELGFHYDNEWLSRNLFEKDGKTLVAPTTRKNPD